MGILLFYQTVSLTVFKSEGSCTGRGDTVIHLQCSMHRVSKYVSGYTEAAKCCALDNAGSNTFILLRKSFTWQYHSLDIEMKIL